MLVKMSATSPFQRQPPIAAERYATACVHSLFISSPRRRQRRPGFIHAIADAPFQRRHAICLVCHAEIIRLAMAEEAPSATSARFTVIYEPTPCKEASADFLSDPFFTPGLHATARHCARSYRRRHIMPPGCPLHRIYFADIP